MDDSIKTIYLTVKLCLKPGQTRKAIQEIVWDLDYSFTHDKIAGHKIVEILDRQTQTQRHRAHRGAPATRPVK